MEKINVKLNVFEGPFDLLYHLIEKNEIDIYDIPIAEITDQYLEYINNGEYINMDSMSEFILMASTLIAIKLKMLLPKKNDEEEETDPREELAQKLLEYKRFKNVATEFKRLAQTAALTLYKPKSELYKLSSETAAPDLNLTLDGITVQTLFNAFSDILRRAENKRDTIRAGFKSVQRDLFTIDEKIDYLRDLIFLTPKFSFASIFKNATGKMEIVVTFLAVLELIKTKEIYVSQENIFGEIIISKYERAIR